LRLVRAHAGSPQHFAILPMPSHGDEFVLTSYYERRYGITPVFYPPSDDHRGLRDVLREITPKAEGKRSAQQQVQEPASDPDDPNKGRFGGKSHVDGWALTAKVDRTEDSDWFEVILTVTAPDPDIEKRVRFHLHPTFRRETQVIVLRRGVAILERYAYGAFTVGVEVFDRSEEVELTLELDLASLPEAPVKFRSR
jgi:hypothetical protein